MFRTALQFLVMFSCTIFFVMCVMSIILFLPAAAMQFFLGLCGLQVGWLGAYGFTMLGIVAVVILGAAAFNER